MHGLQNPARSRSRAIALSKRLRHRGPDWSGCFVGKDCVLVHERLAIVGVGQYYSYFSPFPPYLPPTELCHPVHIDGTISQTPGRNLSSAKMDSRPFVSMAKYTTILLYRKVWDQTHASRLIPIAKSFSTWFVVFLVSLYLISLPCSTKSTTRSSATCSTAYFLSCSWTTRLLPPASSRLAILSESQRCIKDGTLLDQK